jgi:hypothetical protein
MRINAPGWAVIILALTLTIWNVLEYERNKPAYVSYLPNRIMVRWENTPEEYRAIRYKYIEREVLILGAAALAWLVVNRRKAT